MKVILCEAEPYQLTTWILVFTFTVSLQGRNEGLVVCGRSDIEP
jgi:hypothetical protein